MYYLRKGSDASFWCWVRFVALWSYDFPVKEPLLLTALIFALEVLALRFSRWTPWVSRVKLVSFDFYYFFCRMFEELLSFLRVCAGASIWLAVEAFRKERCFSLGVWVWLTAFVCI